MLATTMWAGCALGSTAAPGMGWLVRNGQTLFLKIGDGVPRPSLPFLPFQTPGEMTEPGSPSS
ncbi:MAG: hypothetical protein WCJ64_15595 [Rhodospirillaceae bacterium]